MIYTIQGKLSIYIIAILLLISTALALSDCRDDCSRFIDGEFRCDAECDGINNCTYDCSVTSDFLGGTVKELCHDNVLGWRIRHNALQEIECCSGGYVNKPDQVLAWVEISDNIRNAQTYFAGVINFEPTGELYSVYVVVYSKE